MALVSIFTASYNIFIIINVLIVIHELGHFLCAKLLGAEIDKIIIYPLGGISKFKFPLNFSIIKELLIVISGPIFQFLGYYILLKLLTRYEDIIKLYHYSILIFNLLPIYPLDGGKIINLLLSMSLPFKTSIKVTIMISYISIIVLIIINYPAIYLNLIIMVIFLVCKIITKQRQIDYVYNKFLLERYINKYNFQKSKIIKNGNSFYRSKRHLIKENDNYYLESEYLEKKYKKT